MGRVLAVIGIALTLMYAWFAWWLMGDRIQELQTMNLNEVGDFLAGAFGPVTILWLVLGFFQQGIELRQGTDALRLQAKELSNSVTQQGELVLAQRESLRNYERSLEPLLHLDVGYAGLIGEEFCIDFDVVNSGEYCESVCIKLYSQSGGIRRSDIDPLINGSKSFVRFRNLPEWEDLNVVVEYRTRSGLANTQTFSLVHYEEGRSNSYIVNKHGFIK